MTDEKFASLAELGDFIDRDAEDMTARAKGFFEYVRRRHTVRDFTDEAVPREIIEHCIAAAGRAPSGANHQPWHFCLVGDAGVKKAIRDAAEAEERAF